MLICRLVLLTSLLVLPTLLVALDFEITYGYRHLDEGWSPPPADFEEGAVTGTFTATADIDTAFAQPGLVRVDERTWRYDFGWDVTDSLSFFFADRDGGVHELRTRPSWPSFMPGDRSVPVVILDVELPSLWSPTTGIYVWGDGDGPNWDQRGVEWERQASFRWFDRDGTLRHQRPIGLRINGAWNRYLAQKSLRLYFDHHGEPETIVDDFFGSLPHIHERLILRAGSSEPKLFLRDILATSVFAAAGHERSRWAPVEVYFTDEYWGLYHLRERPDEEWAELTLGLSGEYVMIKDGVEVHGDYQIWRDFLDGVAAEPAPEDNAFFSALNAELDLVSYLDWALLQCWSGTSDNGGVSNLVTVKPEVGRWRFITYDQDGSFSSCNRTHDFFRFFASANQDEFDARHPPSYYPPYSWNCRPLFDLWRQVMSNPRGRRLARQRWQTLNERLFTHEFNASLLDSMVAVQEDAAARQQVRWDWSSSIAVAAWVIKSGIATRQPVASAQFTAFMDEWMDPVELDVFTVAGPAAAIGLAWHTEREVDCAGWLIERRPDEVQPWRTIATHLTHPDSLTATGGPELAATYSFTDTTAPAGEHPQYRLSHDTGAGGPVVHPWIETWGGPPVVAPTIVINEFLASNSTVNADETGAFEDWIELHNTGAVEVSLDGLYLTDDLATPLEWPLPMGLVLEAGGFLLVWCDDEPGDGPLHATFKLSAGGESIGLYLSTDEGVVDVDSHTFVAQITDVSEGRFPDGGPIWVAFDAPTPGSANLPTGVADPPSLSLTLAAWPNPFNPACRLAVNVPSGGQVHLAVYDLAGRRVRLLCDEALTAGSRTILFDGRNDRGALLPSGVYHAVLRAGAARAVVKMAMVR